MIKIQIVDAERDLASADEQWINQQVNLRRKNGENVCVRVTVHEGALNMVLATPSCARGGGNRPPTQHEKAVFDLWRKRGLDDEKFTGGNVVAFLKQLDDLL